MLEAELQTNIIQLAKTYGWLVHHDLPAQTGKGAWLTRTQGDAGFPDLVLAKNGRVLFLELKSEKGKTTPAQDAWMHATGALLVRPSDLEYIAYLLGPNYEPATVSRDRTSTTTA